MSDIRKLMDSAKPGDWQMALRHPEANGEDIDYLLGRMFVAARDNTWHGLTATPERVGRRGPETLPLPSELVRHPAFEPRHMHELVSIRHDLRPGTYGNGEPNTQATYRSPLNGIMGDALPGREKFDDHAIDLMLDHPHDWFRSETDLMDLTAHPAFRVGHLNRILDIVRERTDNPSRGSPAFGQIPYVGNFFKRTPELPAVYLDHLLDFALKNQDTIGTSHLAEQVAIHPNLSDAGFQKLISSDHPRRDALKHRQMSSSQLKSFLTDPKFNDPTWEGLNAEGMAEAVESQKTISPENAELIARHPRRHVRAAFARHPSAPAHILERFLEHEKGMEKHIAQNPGATPEILNRCVQNIFQQMGGDFDFNDQAGTIQSLVENPATPPEAISTLLDKSRQGYGAAAGLQDRGLLRQSVREVIAKTDRPLTAEQRMDLVTDPNQHIAVPALERPDTTPEEMRAAFNTPRKGLHRLVTRAVILGNHPEVLNSQDLGNWLKEETDRGELESYAGMHKNALENGLKHPNMPPHLLNAALLHPDEDIRIMAAQSPHVKGEQLREILTGPENKSNDWKKVIRNNPNITADDLASVALSTTVTNPVLRGEALQHPLASPELLRAIPYQDEPLEVIRGIVLNQHAPADLINKIARDPIAGSMRLVALKHPAISDETLQHLVGGGYTGETFANGDPVEAMVQDPQISSEASKVFAQRHPDLSHDPLRRVRVRFGVGKLRRIRDAIWEHDPVKGEAPPNKLPPGDWSAGRVANGNISAHKLQQVIDAAPEVQYNTSETQWGGAQRHTSEPSNVTQINITDDHVKKMKDAGVFGTFLSMLDHSYQSQHPVKQGHTVGWVRWTGAPHATDASQSLRAIDQQHRGAGIHVDEIQSDFGQNWIKYARAQAEDMGHDPDEAERMAAANWPESHQKAISGILFGGRHPNEAVGEAFMEHLRTRGWHNTPVHIHDVSTKAPLSGMKEDEPLPGHMQFTYKDLPKRMGMKPDTYGKLTTQRNDELKGKATWSDKLRKFDVESWLNTRGAGGDAQAHLGLGGAVEKLLYSVQASGQSRPDPVMLREALVKYDDVQQAVLAVTGADPKLLASIASLTKAEPEPTPERPPGHIAPLTPSAKEPADAVRRAFNKKQVKGVYLGGRHSAGSMLATDPETATVWFLKPGSGGQSPAMGVQEEIASQARREAGFWHIAVSWGLENSLPRAEVIVMDGHDWAALRFLDHAWKNFDDVKRQHPALAIEALERHRRHGLLHRWAVLDWVCGNTDRHGANLMLGPTGGVKLIDHGGAFAGPSFNPGNDPKSFVPFYLRYRSPSWSAVPHAERLGVMTPLGKLQDDELRRWVQGLDVDHVITICHKDGLNPDPPAARLRQVQHLAATVPSGQLHAAINQLWAAC